MILLKRMKTYLILMIFISFIGILLAQGWIQPKGLFLPVEQVEKKWGKKPFDPVKFKKGNEAIRASMAVEVIKDKTLIGKTSEEIWNQLGWHDGYYYSDTIPAYIIEDNSVNGGDVWQIVFLLDRNSKVSSVRVHKNGSEILP